MRTLRAPLCPLYGLINNHGGGQAGKGCLRAIKRAIAHPLRRFITRPRIVESPLRLARTSTRTPMIPNLGEETLNDKSAQ